MKSCSCILVAPSNKVAKSDIPNAKINLNREGVTDIRFLPFFDYFSKWAGSSEHRLRQIHLSFLSDVDYIRAIKGGSGVLHFLSRVNFSFLKKKPKFFVGYSDLTPLLNCIYERTGILSLHGPHVLKKLDLGSISCLKQALQAKNYNLSFKSFLNAKNKRFLNGIAKGGNLSLAAWSMGSTFELNLKNKIVFFEDVDINNFSAYNKLAQLKNSKNFKPKALVFGYMDTVDEKLFLNMLKKLFPSVPIVWGVKFGHCLPNYTIPIGARCKIDFENKLIKFKFPKSAKKYAVRFD